jgi:hypothetical protein
MLTLRVELNCVNSSSITSESTFTPPSRQSQRGLCVRQPLASVVLHDAVPLSCLSGASVQARRINSVARAACLHLICARIAGSPAESRPFLFAKAPVQRYAQPKTWSTSFHPVESAGIRRSQPRTCVQARAVHLPELHDAAVRCGLSHRQSACPTGCSSDARRHSQCFPCRFSLRAAAVHCCGRRCCRCCGIQ